MRYTLKIKILFVFSIIVLSVGATVSTIQQIQEMSFLLLDNLGTEGEVEANSNLNLSEEVLALKNIVTKYAKLNGIESEISVLLAIIMVETRGIGPDPMQSSESEGREPNTLASPEESIKQGVAYYKTCLNLANKLNVTDRRAALQSYNYGIGFLYWLNNNNKSYSFEAGSEFSKHQSNGKKVVYTNPIANSYGNWRYAYGNMFYVKLVDQYIQRVENGQAEEGDFAYSMPVDNPRISSGFGWRQNPLSGEAEFHRGIDFSNGFGTPIKAIASGKVITADYHNSWGNHVVIQHNDGKVSLYAHQSKLLVKAGTEVKQGEIIGQIGSTGHSTGPHLHLEIAKSVDLSQENLLDPSVLLNIKKIGET